MVLAESFSVRVVVATWCRLVAKRSSILLKARDRIPISSSVRVVFTLKVKSELVSIC